MANQEGKHVDVWWQDIPLIGALTHLVNAIAEVFEERGESRRGGIKLPLRRIANIMAITAVGILGATLVLGAFTPLGLICANLSFLLLLIGWGGKSRVDDIALGILSLVFLVLAGLFVFNQLGLGFSAGMLWLLSPPIFLGGVKFLIKTLVLRV